MKRYLGLIVMVVGVLAGGLIFYRNFKGRAVESERAADFARVQKNYLERVGWMRSNPDPKTYTEELTPFFHRYFQEVAEHQARFNGNTRFDGYLAELEGKDASDGKADSRKAFYEYTRKAFDAMHDGRYSPVWTASDQGLRLDVVSADITQVMGRPQIRMPLVLWGASRELKEDGRVKRMLTSASFNTSWKLLDEKGKLVGEMNAGDPSMKIDFPERFIAEFPPQMVLGHYDLDLLPASVKTLEMTIAVASHAATGGQASASFVWKREVPESWKLKSGEKWEGAVESERADEAAPSQAKR